MAKQVFISYSSKDNKIAASICSALETRGHQCWMSSRDVRPGENFQGAIVRAIREARVMVMVFSTNANNSDEIKKEMALASQSRLMVIPVRAEDVPPSEDFTYELATRQWIDMFNDWEQAIEQLGAQIDLAVARDDDGHPPSASPSTPNLPAPKRHRVPLLAGVAAVLMAAGAGAFWLTRPPPPAQAVPQPAPSLASVQPPAPAAMDPAKLESDLWDSVKNSGDAAALNSYLSKYPDGMFAAAAKAKLAALNKPPPVKAAKAPLAAPDSQAAAPAPQVIPASQPAPVSPPAASLNPQVQQAVDQARQIERRARAIAEKAEAIAGQDQSGNAGLGLLGARGGPRRGGRMGGERIGGLDVVTYPDGDRYAGGTRNGTRFGFGILTGASNRIYRERIGQYAADQLNGYGVVYRRDGNVRIGQWKDGLMNGYGAVLDTSGRIVEQGMYANDRLATPMKGN
jgi:hypothetical protein